MHGNRSYWAAGVAPATFSATGTTITDSTGVLTGTRDCASSTCDSRQLAAYDVNQWVTNLNSQFPSYSTTVNCTNTAGKPVSCSVTVNWSEKYVAINRSTAASAAAQAASQALTLYVEP